MKRTGVLGLICLMAMTTANAQTTGPAPAGEPKPVALAVIRDADHPCPKVTRAERLSDGSIKAVCSNGEDYRVFSVKGKPAAMRCSAARRLGVDGC